MTKSKAKTASRHKDFGAPVNQDELEPVSFDLYGDTFNCYKQIHGVTLLRFVKEATSEDGARATEAMLGIFQRVMPDDEYARFEKLCEDPDTVVPVDTLGEIIGWLVEVYSDRPTK
jgi:hypothetical protein